MSSPFSPTVGILLMLNNYVHDVATGLLISSALWLAWSARDLGDSPCAEMIRYFRRTYARCVRFAIGSVVVIIITGIIRTVTFMDFEWQPALGKGLIPVLVMKHVLIFTMLGAGIYAWIQLRRRVRTLEPANEEQHR